MKLDMYRECRHNEMQLAQFYKRGNYTSIMQMHLQQAKKWHSLIMKFRQDEIDENNQIAELMHKYGIVPDYSVSGED